MVSRVFPIACYRGAAALLRTRVTKGYACLHVVPPLEISKKTSAKNS